MAAAPTKDFDAKWGNGYVAPDVFTKIVFKPDWKHCESVALATIVSGIATHLGPLGCGLIFILALALPAIPFFAVLVFLERNQIDGKSPRQPLTSHLLSCRQRGDPGYLNRILAIMPLSS